MHPGIDGNPFGLHASFPASTTTKGYVELFDATSVPDPSGGIIFDVWIYLLLAAVGAWFLLPRWRDPRALVLGSLALSSLTYQLGAFLSMGVQYRLEVPSVATGLVVLLAGGDHVGGRASPRPGVGAPTGLGAVRFVIATIPRRLAGLAARRTGPGVRTD